MTFSLDEHGYDVGRALAYHRDVLPALQSAGEFETVSLSARAPFGSGLIGFDVIPPGGDPETPMRVRANGVSDSYFRLLSIPIVRGRAFTPDEVLACRRHAAADRERNACAPGCSAPSTSLAGRCGSRGDGGDPEQELVIVGVARDSRWRSIAGEPDPFMYQPFAQFRSGGTRGVYMIKSALPARRVGEIAKSDCGAHRKRHPALGAATADDRHRP